MSSTLHTTLIGEPSDDVPRVVFLHGLFGQGRNFTGIAKALQPDFVSLLVDLPDHGRSAWTEQFGYQAMADAVAEELRGGLASDGPVHVVGHSMGGKVAMLLALSHPELVDRLVVVDIAPAVSTDMSTFRHLLDSLAALDLEAAHRRVDAEDQLAQRVEDRTVRAFLLQNLRREGETWRWQANLDLLRAELDDIGGFPDTDAVFENRVLWVAGERSPYIKAEHEAPMRALFPRVIKITVKGAGHWVHSEQPEHFVSTLRSFLG